jgi:hypothetical protein
VLGLEINKALGKKQQPPPALESRPASEQAIRNRSRPLSLQYTTDRPAPNTRRRAARTVYGLSQLDSDIDTTAWRKHSLGYHAQRVTHRAFSHILNDELELDKENNHRAIWLLQRTRRKMLGRVRATLQGAGEGREINISTWARSAGELESRKCALGERKERD